MSREQKWNELAGQMKADARAFALHGGFYLVGAVALGVFVGEKLPAYVAVGVGVLFLGMSGLLARQRRYCERYAETTARDLDCLMDAMGLGDVLSKAPWRSTRTGVSTWHVIPVDDGRNHDEETDCRCGPRVQIMKGGMIIVHNSYDGREAVEWAEEILNK